MAQTGGKGIYSFLNLPYTARHAALGTNILASYEPDVMLSVANPSMINDKIHNQIGLTYVNYIADAQYGMVAYSRSFKKVGSFTGSLQFVNYGKFTEADEAGNTYGTFSGGDYALNIGWGRKLEKHFTIGANLKFIYSHLYHNNSFGMAVDVAGSYIHEKSGFMATAIFKNIGRELDHYVETNEPLPFEIQLAVSQKFNTLPIRYAIVYNHLEKWDLTYTDPAKSNVDPISGDTIQKSSVDRFADKLMRHFVLGLEIYPTKRFYVSLSYNYDRCQELRTLVKKGITGFSFGFGLNVYKFQFNYAWSKFHMAAAPHTFTIRTNISDFTSKKKSPKS
jgi:hypothetical protein